MHYYRRVGIVKDGSYQSSALVVVEKSLRRLGIAAIPPPGYEFSRQSEPPLFLRHDNALGYSANPGVFKHVYKRKSWQQQQWERFAVKVTINPDGSRWTGRAYNAVGPNIFIFGDSFVFGSGVNDEQTFSYMLQAARPDRNVHLFALAGYGLAQTYLRFKQMNSHVSSQDIVIIGYADFFDVRNVAAPSRLRAVDQWAKSRGGFMPGLSTKSPIAIIRPDGEIAVELIDRNCAVSDCNAPDPSQQYMTTVSARLINEIAESTQAKIYLLHFRGSKNNSLFPMLHKRVEVISALPSDFEYFIEDDVEGFDPHPGPYWHYAISRLLIERIK